MSDNDIRTDKAPPPVGAYPHARRAGPFLFLSGVGPRAPEGEAIPGVTLDDDGAVVDYDIAEQTRSVFRNVEAILEAAGASRRDLVDVTVFLTDMKSDFDTFNRLYAEHFRDHRPCRTTVEVGALPTPIAVELKCIAYVGEGDGGRM